MNEDHQVPATTLVEKRNKNYPEEPDHTSKRFDKETSPSRLHAPPHLDEKTVSRRRAPGKHGAGVLLGLLVVSSLIFSVQTSATLVSASGSLIFQDGFESNNFNAWSGTTKTSGETTNIVSTPVYSGVFSARFTNNGDSTYERSYAYESVAAANEIYARGYFQVTQCGIVQNPDYFYLLMLTAGSNYVAYAGWKQSASGHIYWNLMIRDGTSYVSAYSASTPAKNTWYCVELHWKSDSTSGLGELYLDGNLVCSVKNRNTAHYGPATTVRFGLPEIYSCTNTVVYADSAAISSSYIGPTTSPPSPPANSPVEVGIYPPSSKPITTYEQDLGLKLDSILQFQPVKALNYSQIIPLLNRGYDVILNIEFIDSFANLKSIAAGYYDHYLINLANAIKADGRTIWLRPLHEFNGDWYNWGTLYPGNTIADFIPAWRHVVQLFRNNSVPVKFQLDYNSGNGKNNPTPFSAFYPGDQYVDMVVITCYNRADTDQYIRPWRTFAQNFQNPYNQVTALTSKPIGVAETSSTDYSGNKSQWILDTFHSIAYNYTRVQQVTWFLENKMVNGYYRDWDLNTQQQKLAFVQGLDFLRSVRGSYTPSS